MTAGELATATAPTLYTHLRLLEQERAHAQLTGLAENDLYMEDLALELDAVRVAYVGAAVTELASLRAALGCTLQG